MKFKNILRGFVVYFVLILVVSAVVSYLYSLVAHGQGVIDWDSSFRLAFILGVTLPFVSELERKRR
jgi:ABC-type sugar transport system permease subunit